MKRVALFLLAFVPSVAGAQTVFVLQGEDGSVGPPGVDATRVTQAHNLTAALTCTATTAVSDAFSDQR
jgi:hypothetical protein